MTKRRIAVRGIIFKDGQLLAQQTKPGAGEGARDYWCTPGGGLEDGESLHEGLYREMIEETGIAPKIGKLLFIQQYGDPVKKEFLEFFFHIENPQDYEVIDLASTSHGELEIAKVDFISPSTQNILPAFLQTLDLGGYISDHIPVGVHTYLNN